jgi:uroporphyrinogen-III synthase
MNALPLVILTRPQNQSEIFCKNLQLIGREATIFPLFDIEALKNNERLDEKLHQLNQYQLVIFVSPNAVAMVLQRMHQLKLGFPKNLSLAVMGKASKESLLSFGIDENLNSIISPRSKVRTDSETLFDELDFDALKNQSILIFRGETGREFLSDRLREKGIMVTHVSAYQRTIPTLNQEQSGCLKQFLQVKNDWVVTSSTSLQTMIDWAGQLPEVNSVEKMQQQKLFVPHFRIAEVAQQLGFQDVTMTSSGDENILLALQS